MAPGQDSSATRGEDHGGAGCPPAAHGGPRRSRDSPAACGGPHARAGGGLKEAVARGGPAGAAVLEGLCWIPGVSGTLSEQSRPNGIVMFVSSRPQGHH